MTRFLFAFVLVFGCALQAYPQPVQPQPQQEPWANKMFGAIAHNFGVVPLNAQLKHTIPMTNIWKVPLDIQDLRMSCGCVRATPTLNRLNPGQSGNLEIHMDGTKFNGVKTVIIQVKVGSQQYNSTASITVTATTAQAVAVVFNPPNGIEFGSVSKGSKPAQSIEVRNATNAGWQVTEIIKTQTAPFELEVANLGGQGRGYRITATLRGDSAPGTFHEEVQLKTNDPANPVLKFAVHGTVRGVLGFTPQVTLTGLRVGAESNATVVLTADREFRLVGMNGLKSDMNVAIPNDAKKVHILNVKITPTSPGVYRRTIEVQTDLNNESATINIEGMAQQ